MKRPFAVLFLCLARLLQVAAAGPISVPIYIEDNHAGSFYWLAAQLDLEEPCTLLLFDAHSDASGVFDSDLIRNQVRRVASREERQRVLERWRKSGAVQCFSWIEPLMPSPVAEVIWIARDQLGEGESAALKTEAGDLLDGHLEASPRASGLLRSRFRAIGLEQLRNEFREGGPVIASVDLDYFAGLAPEKRVAAFERVWSAIAELRNLRAVTIAVSRPYLSGDEEADALVQLALRSALSLPTATIQFEPYRTVADDRSVRAQEYRAQKQEVPSFDVARASPELRSLLLANEERIVVRHETTRWKTLLREWIAEAPIIRLGVKGQQPATDGIWRLPARASAEIQLLAEPWYAAADRVQWIAELPIYPRCNLVATSAEEVGFGQGAPPRPRWREVRLSHAGATLPTEELQRFFDPGSGCGAVRLKARVNFGGAARETQAMELRRFAGSGFRAALTEQFGLRYLYGSGALHDRGATGPETGWGADCANFIVHALRRQGARIPWSNPKQLRRHLELLHSNISLSAAAQITATDIEQGLFIHLGQHVAAVTEDRPPLGVLNADDLVAHQLEGPPETLALGALLEARGARIFDLLRTHPREDRAELLVGGDVMLGRTVGDHIRQGVDPFSGIRELLAAAETTLINLESIVSARGAPVRGKQFHLRAPREAVGSLQAAGVDLVGLANNHANDFGDEGLVDALTLLRAGGMQVLGAAESPESAYAAHVFATNRTQRVAVMAVSDFAASDKIATTSDRARLSRALGEANERSDFVVVLVHWGEENTPVVTERQRELARWFVDEGVDLVVGSHPHCVQPLDYYRGRPIAYSLGNLVFDGAPSVSSWNAGQLLSVSFDPRNKSPEVHLIPVKLDARGFPQLERARELAQQE